MKNIIHTMIQLESSLQQAAQSGDQVKATKYNAIILELEERMQLHAAAMIEGNPNNE